MPKLEMCRYSIAMALFCVVYALISTFSKKKNQQKIFENIEKSVEKPQNYEEKHGTKQRKSLPRRSELFLLQCHEV